MGLLTAIGIGLAGAGAAAQAASGIAGASAQEDIARAQMEEARKNREAAMAAAKPSPQELALLDRQIQTADRAIARQERILAEVDPALMESGRQALALLKGQEAGALAPIRAERQRQREALRAQLRNQLGSGYETSSAGIEALTRFDQETSTALQGAQQQTLGMLLGTAQNVAQPGISGASFAGVNALGIPQQAMQQGRMMTMQSILGTPTTQYAGAESIGAAKRAETFENIAGGISKLGGNLFGYSLKNGRFNQNKKDTWDFNAEIMPGYTGGETPEYAERTA